MQIIFKVREGCTDEAEPVAKRAVSEIITQSGMKDVEVRQLFPGLTAGQRARLFILEVADGLSDQKIAEAIEALRNSEAVEYAELPAQKRPL